MEKMGFLSMDTKCRSTSLDRITSQKFIVSVRIFGLIVIKK